jgi:hypothetical protein
MAINSNKYALSWIENPRVGGSIPPLGTIFYISLAPANLINDLAHYFKFILRFVPRFVPLATI